MLKLIVIVGFAFAGNVWGDKTVLSHREWIKKTYRHLIGNPPLNGSVLGEWEKLTEDQVIEKIFDYPEFLDTALKFNLHFLGINPASLYTFEKSQKKYDTSIFDLPSALISISELAKNGDYLALLKFPSTLPIAPIPEKSDVFQAKATKHLEDFKAFRSVVFANPKMDGEEICDQLGSKLFFASLLSNNPNVALHFYLGLYCPFNLSSRDDAIMHLDKVIEVYGELTNTITNFTQDQYQLSNMKALKFIPGGVYNTVFEMREFGIMFYYRDGFFNSSTNFNRKRAAYVLSHYFCDDLSALPIELDEEKKVMHTQNRHASDPKCIACHYKLDPMAGFFRHIGIRGFNYQTNETIIFDDSEDINRKDYEDNWKSLSPNRKFDIGYVRDPVNEKRNTYGESMKDLFNIISSAPEVKACIVKKLSNFIVGSDALFDGGYLSHLSSKFENESKDNSSTAFKNVIATLVKSQTFRQKKLDPNQCYDYVPGSSPAISDVPCKVRHLLVQNCLQCHKGENPSGGLSFDRYENGTFHHYNAKESRNYTKEETFQKIVESLTSTDPDIRMPYLKPISGSDRQALHDWAYRELYP